MPRNNVQQPNPSETAEPVGEARAWLAALSEEDLMFVRRFVLASGSLKAVARSYDISYPTVRLRLDRLIQKIEVVEAHREASPFERRVRLLYAEGRIDLEAVKELLREHQDAIRSSNLKAPRTGMRRAPQKTGDAS